MKNFLWIILIGLSLSGSFISCNRADTYAREIERERVLINDFIRRHNIETTSTMPGSMSDMAEMFRNNPNLFYRSTNGLLFRLERPTNRPLSDTIQPHDRLLITARFIEYTLTARADTADFRSMDRFPSGFQFYFGTQTNAPHAFIQAVGYMRGSGAKARIIVPHRIGFQPTIVTPFGYDIEIQFRRDEISQ